MNDIEGSKMSNTVALFFGIILLFAGAYSLSTVQSARYDDQQRVIKELEQKLTEEKEIPEATEAKNEPTPSSEIKETKSEVTESNPVQSRSNISRASSSGQKAYIQTEINKLLVKKEGYKEALDKVFVQKQKCLNEAPQGTIPDCSYWDSERNKWETNIRDADTEINEWKRKLADSH